MNVLLDGGQIKSSSSTAEREPAAVPEGGVCAVRGQAGGRDTSAQFPQLQRLPLADVRQARHGVTRFLLSQYSKKS